MFFLSPSLAAPAPVGHYASSHPGLVIGWQVSGPQGMLANKQDEKQVYTEIDVALTFFLIRNLKHGMHELSCTAASHQNT